MTGMFLLLILVNFWHFQQHTVCQFQSVLGAKVLIIITANTNRSINTYRQSIFNTTVLF